MKIKNDKYYTSNELAEYIVDKTKEIIGENNISEYLESSAGNGVFLDYLPSNTLAYDIEPEHENIIKQDYLSLELEHKKGRCIIGNPPFGKGNDLAIKFFKKSIQIADYISFILPISQLNNTERMFEFDLIHSEDLGLKEYSNINLHCCLNIYRRNKNGNYNKKISYKLKDIEIIEYRRNVRRDPKIYENTDIGICAYGSGIMGRTPKYLGQYVREMYFNIKNKELKNQVIKLIKDTNWEKDVCRGISGQLNLSQWQIYKYIKEQIPEIK